MPITRWFSKTCSLGYRQAIGATLTWLLSVGLFSVISHALFSAPLPDGAIIALLVPNLVAWMVTFGRCAARQKTNSWVTQ